MRAIENYTTYGLEELLALAEREKNKKRNYLLVNRLQAKHIPTSPKKAIQLFTELGETMASHYQKERVIVIGFAETATAIGAVVAQTLGKETIYLSTTREAMDEQLAVVSFLEEHSHATEQALYAANAQAIFQRAERILFVEDEITTGKTILNFITVLKQRGFLTGKKLAVASIVNSMTEEHQKRFAENKVECHYLLRLAPDFKGIVFQEHALAQEKQKRNQGKMKMLSVPGRMEPRAGVFAIDYQKALQKLADAIVAAYQEDCGSMGGSILVLGTEECMIPALLAGKKLEEVMPNCQVYSHATTRSPIVACRKEAYPLYNRQSLESIYEKGRHTFLYNLRQYDAVYVVTDAEQINEAGVLELFGALEAYGNTKISLVRWIK